MIHIDDIVEYLDLCHAHQTFPPMMLIMISFVSPVEMDVVFWFRSQDHPRDRL